VIIAVAIASILAFVIVFWKAGVVPAAQKAIATASHAGKVMSSKELDDDVKEKEVQKSAIGLVGSVVSITVRSVVSLIAAAVPIYGAEAAGLVGADAVIDFLSRWDVIIIVSVVMIAGYIVGRRVWRAR
jgi:hypothetical protein